MSDFDCGLVNGINLGLSFAAFVAVIFWLVVPAMRARWGRR